MNTAQLRRVAKLSDRVLPEATPPDHPIRYVEISAVGSDGQVAVPSSTIAFGDAPSRARKLAGRDSVLISTVRTYLRAIAKAPAGDDLVYSTGFAVIDPIGDGDPRILAYACRADCFVEEVVSRSVGVSYPAISPSELMAVPVPVVATSEQQRIADFLDDRVSRIDNIIAARRQQISVSAAAEVTAIRAKLAGVGIDGAQALPSTIPWVSAFSPFTAPRRLARVLTLQRGADLTDDERISGAVPVVTTAGVSGTHNRSIARGPGVIIGRYGSVGNVHWVDEDFWPHNTTLYVRDTFGNDLRWCYYLLLAYPYAALQARAAIPGINRNDMAPEFVPWVNVEIQRRAANELDEMSADWRSRSRELSASIELLIEYKQSLITAAVTGEFDVTTASTEVPA